MLQSPAEWEMAGTLSGLRDVFTPASFALRKFHCKFGKSKPKYESLWTE